MSERATDIHLTTAALIEATAGRDPVEIAESAKALMRHMSKTDCVYVAIELAFVLRVIAEDRRVDLGALTTKSRRLALAEDAE